MLFFLLSKVCPISFNWHLGMSFCISWMICICIFNSDNGRKCINEVLYRLFEELYGDNLCLNGCPGHSQTQGCVEHRNRTVQNRIWKLAHLVGVSHITQLMGEIDGENDKKSGSFYQWVS